jgi:hypothetical protein
MKIAFYFCCSKLRPWAIVLSFMLLLPGLAAGQEFAAENPYKVKAAFLRNFAHYVTWPTDAFSAKGASWCVGILGQDPFGKVLEATFEGRTEQGRAFVISRANTPGELPLCQIVFIAFKDAAKRRAALNELKGKPVLTVGDAPEFLREGGIIRFRVGEHVEMSINLDQARSASLAIPTKMLEVSHEVVENGMPRRWR